MASGIATGYANYALTWLYTTAAVTRPTSWSVALYSDASGLPSTTPPSTELTNSTAPGYAKQSVSFGTSAITGDAATNAADLQFASTSGAWPTANYFAIVDQSGAMMHWGALSSAETIGKTGDKIDFAAGSLTVKL